MLIRRMLGLKDGQKIDKRKPVHGNCCTCQKCGYGHDDCKCWENDKIEICEYVEATQAENAKLKDRIVEYDEFANERAISDFAKDEEIDKLKALLQDALPHIECKNASQSGLITAIGETLEGE